MKKIKLGVNIDHVATLRQQRKAIYPDLLDAARAAVKGGADSITVHLREDRRHIQDHDVKLLRKRLTVPLNLEMALSEDIITLALSVRPDQVTLVPEKRRELTTEGGLDIVRYAEKIRKAIERFRRRGIPVSLFLEPEKKHMQHAIELGAQAIELHTGTFTEAFERGRYLREYRRLSDAALHADSLGLRVHAGHGLDYANVVHACHLQNVVELNIGFSIVARAVFVGMEQAVKEMRRLIPHQRESGHGVDQE